MDAETFRRLGHQWVDWVADYRTRMESLPVMSSVAPGDIRARLPASPPRDGGQMESAFALVERDILPGITHWNHPSFFAYFPSNTSFASVLADLVAAGLGAQGMSWQTSPAVTEVEEVAMDWLRQMVGLPDSFTGVIQDTASTATLTALLCARERTTDLAQLRGGLQGREAPLTIYTSELAHSSVRKAALLAGFGADHLRTVPVAADLSMDVAALAAAIDRDRAAGLVPCAIVATAGTTGATAFDPLASIAEVAQRGGLWLHVDAAMAGSAMILPEARPLFAGIERADSLVFNPHKWLGVGFDFSAYYVRDAEHLVRVMGTQPAYLRTVQDGAVKNYRDWHIQLGRRFRSLKLLFVLLDTGVEGLEARLRRDLENARWLADRVRETSDWELLAPVPLQTLCIRHVPAARAGDADWLDAHNAKIAAELAASGLAYLTTDVLRGKRVLRVSVGAEATEERHVAALWTELQRLARHDEGAA
ncbi:MAG: pyridoxal-dependent decarboxylase [Polyangiaceae bacterium]